MSIDTRSLSPSTATTIAALVTEATAARQRNANGVVTNAGGVETVLTAIEAVANAFAALTK